MSVYAIGDIQGCYSCLRRLLDKLQFDPSNDQLWFCGDLINRGPESLQALQFIKSLGDCATSVLGNHDLHVLALHDAGKVVNPADSLYDLFINDEFEELINWLSNLPLAHFDPDLNCLMVHAGIHPAWTISATLQYSREIENVLQSSESSNFYNAMYGDEPKKWSDNLSGQSRNRCLTNIFTRMRFLNKNLELDFDAKGGLLDHESQALIPWFEFPLLIAPETRVVFGHWSTLSPLQYGQCFALDAGCVWGGKLLAIEICREQPEWYSIDCDAGGR